MIAAVEAEGEIWCCLSRSTHREGGNTETHHPVERDIQCIASPQGGGKPLNPRQGNTVARAISVQGVRVQGVDNPLATAPSWPEILNHQFQSVPPVSLSLGRTSGVLAAGAWAARWELASLLEPRCDPDSLVRIIRVREWSRRRPCLVQPCSNWWSHSQLSG